MESKVRYVWSAVANVPAVAELSISLNSVACVSNLIVPALISKSASGARTRSPLVVAIVSVFVPAAIVISDTSHSLIFLVPSTITSLLACRVPAVVGKRSVYSVPAIVKTALPVAGLPI